jgi:N-acetylneuraminic acid mutarotase
VKLWLAVLLVGCKTSAALPDAPVGPWTTGPVVPDPRLEPGVTALGQQMVVIGGFDTDVQAGLEITKRVDVLDTLNLTWSQLPDAPVARHHVQIGAIGTTIYLLGGLGTPDENNDYPAEGDSYSFDTGDPNAVWTTLTPMPTGFERGSAAVVVVPPRIYLLGGASTTDAIASNIFYDSVQDAWCPGTACTPDQQLPDLPSPRSHPAAMRRDDSTFILVGGLLHLGSNTEEPDVFILHPDQQTAAGAWVNGTPEPDERGGCAYGVIEGQLICAGGEAGNSALSYTEGYDVLNDVWTDYAVMPQPRAGTLGAAIADKLYVPGGAAEIVFEPTDSLYIFTLNDTAGTH